MAETTEIAGIDPDGPPPERGTREYMLWMAARSRRSAKTGRPPKNGGVRRAERELTAERLRDLEPEAVDLLESHMKGDDPRLAQSAAKLLLEYHRGKPTQSVKSESNVVTEIRYESAAWRPPIN